jgi:addiction module RelB/DinJ family antitoxin
VDDSIGLDVSTAVRMFFSACLWHGGIPFELRRYNSETLQAMEDADAGRNLYGPFRSAEELMASLDLSDEELERRYHYDAPWAQEKQPKVAEDSEDAYKV